MLVVPVDFGLTDRVADPPRRLDLRMVEISHDPEDRRLILVRLTFVVKELSTPIP